MHTNHELGQEYQENVIDGCYCYRFQKDHEWIQMTQRELTDLLIIERLMHKTPTTAKYWKGAITWMLSGGIGVLFVIQVFFTCK